MTGVIESVGKLYLDKSTFNEENEHLCVQKTSIDAKIDAGYLTLLSSNLS